MNQFIEIIHIDKTFRQYKTLINKNHIIKIDEIIDENGNSYCKIEDIDGNVIETLNDYYALKNEL